MNIQLKSDREIFALDVTYIAKERAVLKDKTLLWQKKNTYYTSKWQWVGCIKCHTVERTHQYYSETLWKLRL